MSRHLGYEYKRRPGVSIGISFEAQLAMKVRDALERHANECSDRPKAILLNPGNFNIAGWHEALGLPVVPDERVEPMRARIVCGTGRAGYCDEGKLIWDAEGRPSVLLSADTD